MKTRDVAFAFRMGAGFAGDVNRTHPMTIVPELPNATNPPTLYGQAVLMDVTTQTIRRLIPADTAVTRVYGITVRSFPTQQSSGSNYGEAALGAAVPPTTGVTDVLRSGYIMVQLFDNFNVAKKGGPVFVWVAANSGNHVTGGFEDRASAGNTAALLDCTFNGTPDANGVVELAYNI